MAKYIDDIIKDIDENPFSWRKINYPILHHQDTVGIYNKNIQIYNLPIITIEIKDDVNTLKYSISNIDDWKLNRAVKRWFKRVPLSHLIKKGE